MYKTILHKFFDVWIGENRLLCNYEGYDVTGKKIIESYKKHSFVESYDVKEHFTAEIDGIDAFTPTYKIESPNTKLITKIDFSRLVHFYEKGNVVAILQLHFSNTQKSHLEIKNKASIQNPLFYLIYSQMFYFIGEY